MEKRIEKRRFEDKKSYQKFLENIKNPNCDITNLDIANLRIGNKPPTEQDVLDLVEAIRTNTSLNRVDMQGIKLSIKTLSAIKGIFRDEQGNVPNTTLEFIEFSREATENVKNFDSIVKEIDLILKHRWPELANIETLTERGLLSEEANDEFDKITKPPFSPQFEVKKSLHKQSPKSDNDNDDKNKIKPS